jgi:hypothetical protein
LTSVALDSGIDFRITVPWGWWELPVASEHLHDDIAGIVDARLTRSPDVLPQRDEIVALLEGAAAEARAAGAIYCAQIGIVEEDGAGFAASLIVAVRPLPGLTIGREADELDRLVRALPPPDGVRPSEVRVQSVTIGRLGTGVRRRVRREEPGGFDVVNISYYFHVRGTAHTAIVNATSPDCDAADELVELLDDIVATIVVTPAARRLPRPEA